MAFLTVKAPHILLPKKGTDLNAYAVIACDQFTSNLDYWNGVKELTKDKLSTYHMIFPEAYLGKVDESKYIENINKNIEKNLSDGSLNDVGQCFILVDRSTKVVPHRLGLIISIDLEDYSYQKGVKSLIRASEATIVERIPPRLKIRENAAVEFPHILFLFDDKDKQIVEKLYENRKQFKKVYDFELNNDGGHIVGYKIENTQEVIAKFEKLLKKNNNGLLFIVGDGNHSLATAKAHWDKIKENLSSEERISHPARFALVEALNIYDRGLIFEPIHRIIFNAEDDFIIGLKKRLDGDYSSYLYSKEKGKVPLKMMKNAPMCYKVVQDYIDEYLLSHKHCSVDYIHDEDELINVANKNENSIAILMPALTKEDVFDYIAKDEVLPRKTFSMGHAYEKRYYLEGKKIK